MTYKILNKYNFTYEKDKNLLINFLNKLNILNKDLEEVLEIYLNKYKQFDKRILYNPIELLDAIFENDLLGEKIDTDEVENIIKNLTFFKDFYEGKISEKEFLEKKYGVKIILLNKDILFPNTEIYGHKLLKYQQIFAFKKIKKLLEFYPIVFIKNINLANIIVSSYFYKKDTLGTTILGGFETLSDNNIYLALHGIEQNFHHELYHQAMQYWNDFNKWKKIREKQNLDYLYKDINKKVYGFARNYGKENISEDQATVAEELITNYHNLCKRIKKDKILKEKVKLVFKAYKELSEGKMNKDFWKEKFGFYCLD